ncbi:MAG: POTRA domain-containing protein [Candidatus Saccharicenans sp.]
MRRKSFWLAGFLIMLIFAAFSSEAAVKIKKITFLVDGQPAEQELSSLAGLQAGEDYSELKIDQALKRLLSTGLYASGEVFWEPELQQELIFKLSKNLFLNRLEIDAPKEVKKRITGEVLPLKPGTVFHESSKEKIVSELKRIIEEEGFYSSNIDLKAERRPGTDLVDLTVKFSDWRRIRLRKITFEGSSAISQERLKGLFGLKPGDFYRPKKVEKGLENIKKAYQERDFRWVEVAAEKENFDPQSGQMDLRINIVPGVRIKIEIKGFHLSPKLVERVWEQKVFEEWALSEGEAILLKYLRKKGYLFASVRPSLQRTEEERRAVYEVHAGPKLKVKEIAFKGNKSFSEAELKKNLGITSKFLFLPYLDGQELYDLNERLKLFYETKGFPQASVSLNFVRQDGSVRPVYYIEEGPRQLIKSLEIQGAKSFNSAEIIRELESRPGQPYYRPALQKDLERINLFYLNRGFRGMQFSLEVSPDKDNNVDVLIRVDEGKRYRVDNIFITGNRLTSRRLIQKEIRLKPGDWASYQQLLETRRGLDSLGVFSEVKIEEVPAGEDRINLSFKLKEGEQNFASLGLGVETREELRSAVLWENEFRPRVTAEYIRYNLFKNASQISLVGQFSLAEKRLVATWQQPYIFGLKMRTYLSGYLEKEDRTSFSYERRGFILSTRRALPANFSLLLSAGALRTQLTNLKISESEVERERLPYSIAYGSATLIKDTRDDTFNPSRGYFFSLAFERAYPLLHTESNFRKLFGKFQYFYPLAQNVDFYTTVRLGLAFGLVPIPERFFGGGSNSFRGTGFERLGPEDPASGLPLGGKSIFLLNMEGKFLMFKSLPNLYGAVFYDVGNVFAEPGNFNFFKLKQAVGLGLRYRTPLGPVRFDVGWNLNPPDGKWRPLFFLTIGNMF